MKLNAKGQCPNCLIKPLRYKRHGGPHFFCHRCDRAFDIETGEQIRNWAWQQVNGEFQPTYPKHDYAKTRAGQ